ncbi:MAG: hypothetical protein Kow0031_36710 [Anaerolineae bacterium]
MKSIIKYQWFFLVVMALLATTGLAYAHAGLDHAEPAVDAVLTTPPAEVHAWFGEELFRHVGANSLAVFGPTGTQVDRGDMRIDDDDRHHMLVSLSDNLPEGRYTVRWQTSSADDGDSDSGEFGFSVGASAAVAPPPVPAESAATNSALPCLGGLVFGMLAVGAVIAPVKRNSGNKF